MSTEFCQTCKQSHPGRVCDYNDQGDCVETIEVAPAPTEKAASRGEVAAPADGSRIGHLGR